MNIRNFLEQNRPQTMICVYDNIEREFIVDHISQTIEPLSVRIKEYKRGNETSWLGNHKTYRLDKIKNLRIK